MARKGKSTGTRAAKGKQAADAVRPDPADTSEQAKTPGRSSDAFASESDSPEQPSWEQALDLQTTGQLVTAQRAAERRYARGTIVAFILFTLAFIALFTPFVLQQRASMQESKVADAAVSHVMGWPSGKAERMFAEARAYNRALAASGQPVIGNASDPFSTASSKSASNSSRTSTTTSTGSSSSDQSTAGQSKSEAWLNDKRYLSLLNVGEGVMGSIQIPKISVNLPIYHGTSDNVLDDGVGHLYGTSLPVGGPSSHSVLTAHRGLSNKTLFTRLDEMRVGDPFYIKIMNETLGYRVIKLQVIEPTEIKDLTIRKGEDLVTLMTCTPYGVNTHRLLVIGKRANIPKSIPEPQDATQDIKRARTVSIATFATALVYGLLALRFRPGLYPVRHRKQHAGTGNAGETH